MSRSFGGYNYGKVIVSHQKTFFCNRDERNFDSRVFCSFFTRFLFFTKTIHHDYLFVYIIYIWTTLTVKSVKYTYTNMVQFLVWEAKSTADTYPLLH